MTPVAENVMSRNMETDDCTAAEAEVPSNRPVIETMNARDVCSGSQYMTPIAENVMSRNMETLGDFLC